MSKLTSAKVQIIFFNCLYTEEEIQINPNPTDFVKVEGIMNTVGFHPGRLKESEPEIIELLEELPEEFKEG